MGELALVTDAAVLDLMEDENVEVVGLAEAESDELSRNKSKVKYAEPRGNLSRIWGHAGFEEDLLTVYTAVGSTYALVTPFASTGKATPRVALSLSKDASVRIAVAAPI